MKTKLLLFSILSFATVISTRAETHTISNSGLTFSPNEITIVVGDIINWELGSNHNVVEVSKDTWDASGNASNGGFSLDFGGGEVTFETAGTYYYVCAPHASSGMKGVVTVEEVPSSIDEIISENFPVLSFYPNPVRDLATLEFSLDAYSNVKIELFDITGRSIQILVDESFSEGEYSKEINQDFVQDGKYVLYFKANDEVRVQQIFKLD